MMNQSVIKIVAGHSAGIRRGLHSCIALLYLYVLYLIAALF